MKEQRIKSSLLIDKRKIVQRKAWWHVWRELKQKDYDIHFKSFKLELLSSRRAHIFSKASISWSSRTGVELTSSSCSSKVCTTSSYSTWWVSIWDNDCSNWTSSICRTAILKRSLHIYTHMIETMTLFVHFARHGARLLENQWDGQPFLSVVRIP